MTNKTIIAGFVALAFVGGTLMVNPTTVDALSPWANDMLDRIGILETQTVDLQSQIDSIPSGPQGPPGVCKCPNS